MQTLFLKCSKHLFISLVEHLSVFNIYIYIYSSGNAAYSSPIDTLSNLADGNYRRYEQSTPPQESISPDQQYFNHRQQPSFTSQSSTGSHLSGGLVTVWSIGSGAAPTPAPGQHVTAGKSGERSSTEGGRQHLRAARG
jgi:hypothetical protein